MRLFIHRR